MSNKAAIRQAKYQQAPQNSFDPVLAHYELMDRITEKAKEIRILEVENKRLFAAAKAAGTVSTDERWTVPYRKLPLERSLLQAMCKKAGIDYDEVMQNTPAQTGAETYT